MINKIDEMGAACWDIILRGMTYYTSMSELCQKKILKKSYQKINNPVDNTENRVIIKMNTEIVRRLL